MANNWNNFVLLMWKNWVLMKRHPVATLFAMLIPLLIGTIPVLLRMTGEPEQHDDKYYEPFESCMFFPHVLNQYSNLRAIDIPNTIMYYPEDTNTHAIIMRALDPFSDYVGYEAFKTVELMEEAYKINASKYIAAIQFDYHNNNNKAMDISIRFPSELRAASGTWKTNLIYPQLILSGPRVPENNTGADPSYYLEQFFCIQEMIAKAIPEAGVVLPTMTIQRFPYPQWISDPLLESLSTVFAMMLMFAFIYPVSNTIKSIAVEKETQIKEAMKIMGLSNWLHWTGWFVTSFILLLIPCIILSCLYKIDVNGSALFTHADISVILVVFILTSSSLITLAFLVSVCFTKANIASLVGQGVCFLLYLPYAFFGTETGTSLVAKVFMSLFCNSAMGFGWNIITSYEGTGEGAQWGNLFQTVTPDDNYTLGGVMLMLLLDTFIYLLLALYIENVFPGQYGVGQPWNYPFKMSYWRGIPADVDRYQSEEIVNEEFEKPPENLPAGIEIQKLRKEFKNNVAVSGLNLKMYENQITVLLGHNGAGKTTTMSILTGMIRPTSGTALIDGRDIRTDMSGVRRSLGFCPQHNIIFQEMTVSEHLYFFSKLKGMQKSEIQGEIDRYIKLLELEPKRHARSSSLSGGMKRKLCVAIALCGNSKVVMLDEPTAGVDPSARRALWEFLQSQKEGRTILLSTHFMDEADLLGDRIAIMAKGKLQCCGSSFFLKKRFGAGYYLILEKAENCNPQKITMVLRKYIPSIEIMGNAGSELSYCLNENYSGQFENLLKDLEDNSDNLGIRSFGISLTTLEEVFLKVGADHLDQSEINNGSIEIKPNSDIKLDINYTVPKLSGPKLILNQIHAMSLKKSLSIIRSWKTTLCQLLIPILFGIIVMTSEKTLNKSDTLPARDLTLGMFGDTKTLIEGGTNTLKDLKAKYGSIIESTVSEVTNITEAMINLRKHDVNDVRFNYLVGASFDDEKNAVNAWFNNDALHSPGVATSLLWSAILKQHDFTVKFINSPMPLKPETRMDRWSKFQSSGINVGQTVVMSMIISGTIFIVFIIRERVSKSKHLQFVSGVKLYIFWTITYVIDYCLLLIMMLLLIGTMFCFQQNGYATGSDFGRLFVTLLLFGIACLPCIYLCGSWFSVPITGYVNISGLFMIVGVVGYITINMLVKLALEKEDLGNSLDWIFALLPHYGLLDAIINTYNLYTKLQLCEEYPNYVGCATKEGYFDFDTPGIGRDLFYFFIVGVTVYLLLLLIDYKIFSRISYFLQRSYFKIAPTPNEDEDSDVLNEKNKINATSEDELKKQYTFVMKDVTKYYKKFLAVNGIYLRAKGNECFGLLGVNGAGKTTTFKMMTGDIRMSRGEAWVNGLNIKNQLNEVRKYIGYCPQFDALLDDLTARETIKMFALLRGIPNFECNALAEELAKNFDFTTHLDKEVRALSGGNKRKLSTAISLIGDPPILFLDEPTTGMDPATKRYLWNALCKIRDSGKLIILTSHSMEECEALCTRLAIMVNGNFKCLGSIQHLKNKFAGGYTLTLKVRKMEFSHGLEHSETTNLETFISASFPGSVLREKHQEMLVYFVPGTALACSKMFGILERAKHNASLNIEDYSLGQSNLEQVFLQFTKHQAIEENKK